MDPTEEESFFRNAWAWVYISAHYAPATIRQYWIKGAWVPWILAIGLKWIIHHQFFQEAPRWADGLWYGLCVVGGMALHAVRRIAWNRQLIWEAKEFARSADNNTAR
jgi:hypothetical protein